MSKEANKFVFTMARLRALPAAEKGRRPYYWDEKQPRLCLRVTERGAKTFYYLHRDAAGQDLIRIGSFPAVTVEVARKAAAGIAAQIAQGNNPAQARRNLKGEPTLGELFEHYARHLQKNERRTTDKIRAMFELYLGAIPDEAPKLRGRQRVKPAGAVDWSRRKVSAISTEDVARLHTAVTSAGRREAANKAVKLLRAMYNVARKDKLVGGQNPAQGVDLNPEPQRDRHLSTEELKRFFAALEDEPADWRDFFTVLLMTGQRLMNVASMRWQDVDLSAGTWSLSAVQTKQGRPVIVPLSRQAAEILDRRRTEASSAVFVFPANGDAGHITRPHKRWKPLIERAGLDNVRMHDLRHTAASRLAQGGASLQVIGAALGHRDIQSTMRYAHLTVDPVRDAVQVAHDRMLNEPAQVIPMKKKGAA